MRRLIAEDKKEFTFSELEPNVQDKVVKKFISGEYTDAEMCSTVEDLCYEKFNELTSDIRGWDKYELDLAVPFDGEHKGFKVAFEGHIERNMKYGAGLAQCVYGDTSEFLFQMNECDAISSVWFEGDANSMNVELNYDANRDAIQAVMEVFDKEEDEAVDMIEKEMNKFEQRLTRWAKKLCKDLSAYCKSLNYKEMFYDELNEDNNTLYTEDGDILE